MKLSGKIKNLSGQTFNRLTVIEFSHKDENSKGLAYWRCICVCGNIVVTRGTGLTNGQTKSCGCLQREFASTVIKKYGRKTIKAVGVAALNNLYLSYKRSASRRKLNFNISINEFKIFTKRGCFYCGTPPIQIHGDKRYNGGYIYNGIDRKDNTIGYEIKNCVSCCKICNILKMTLSAEEFLSHVERIYNHSVKSRAT
jgi:hypothetical protein